MNFKFGDLVKVVGGEWDQTIGEVEYVFDNLTGEVEVCFFDEEDEPTEIFEASELIIYNGE